MGLLWKEALREFRQGCAILNNRCSRTPLPAREKLADASLVNSVQERLEAIPHPTEQHVITAPICLRSGMSIYRMAAAMAPRNLFKQIPGRHRRVTGT